MSVRGLVASVALAMLVVMGGIGTSPADALERSYIPLPEILTDTNEGNTYGALAVVLFLDEQKII